MIELLLIPVAIIIHEFGHYVGYMLLGYKPNIKIKWYGIIMGENVWPYLKAYEGYIVTMMGILAGFFIVKNNSALLTTYIAMCCTDFTNIISILNIKKEDRKKRFIDISINELNELKQKWVKEE